MKRSSEHVMSEAISDHALQQVLYHVDAYQLSYGQRRRERRYVDLTYDGGVQLLQQAVNEAMWRSAEDGRGRVVEMRITVDISAQFARQMLHPQRQPAEESSLSRRLREAQAKLREGVYNPSSSVWEDVLENSQASQVPPEAGEVPPEIVEVPPATVSWADVLPSTPEQTT